MTFLPIRTVRSSTSACASDSATRCATRLRRLGREPRVQREAGRLRLEPDLVDRVGDLLEHLLEHRPGSRSLVVEGDHVVRVVEAQLDAVGADEQHLVARGRDTRSRSSQRRAGDERDAGARQAREPLEHGVRASGSARAARGRRPRARGCRRSRARPAAARCGRAPRAPLRSGSARRAIAASALAPTVHSRSPCRPPRSAPGARPTAAPRRSAVEEVARPARDVVLEHPLAQRRASACRRSPSRHVHGAQDRLLQPLDVVRVDSGGPAAARRRRRRTRSARARRRRRRASATYSFATRFIPSRSAVTSMTSAARYSATISSRG